MWGPDLADGYNNTRQSDDTRLTIEGTVGLTGTLGDLLSTKTEHKSCQLLHGAFFYFVVKGVSPQAGGLPTQTSGTEDSVHVAFGISS